MLKVNDLVATHRSYDAVMPTIECAYEDANDGHAAFGFLGILGSLQNCLWLGIPAGGKAATSGNGPVLPCYQRTVSRLKTSIPLHWLLALRLKGTRDCAAFIRSYIRSTCET